MELGPEDVSLLETHIFLKEAQVPNEWEWGYRYESSPM